METKKVISQAEFDACVAALAKQADAAPVRSIAEIDAEIANGGGLGRMDRLLKERKAALAQRVVSEAVPFGYVATLASPGGAIYHWSRIVRDRHDAEACVKQWSGGDKVGVMPVYTTPPAAPVALSDAQIHAIINAMPESAFEETVAIGEIPALFDNDEGEDEEVFESIKAYAKIVAYRAILAAATQPMDADKLDAERLNWLEKNSAYVAVNPHHKTCLWTLRGIFEVAGKDFMGAIDAAIAASAKEAK